MSEDKAPVDPLEAAGCDLQWNLKTSTRRWISVFAIAFTGVLGTGPTMAFPTMEPLLIDEGVWAGPKQLAMLTQAAPLVVGFPMVWFALCGPLVDILGPRVTFMIGTLGSSIALATVALAIAMPEWNDLLWIALPFSTMGQYVNGLLPMLYYFPGNEATVSSLVAMRAALGDGMCLLAPFLHDKYGVKCSTYYGFCAALSILSSLVGSALLPTRNDYRSVYHRMRRNASTTNQNADKQSITDHEPDEVIAADEYPSVWAAMKEYLACYQRAWVLCFRVHRKVYFRFLWYCATEIGCGLYIIAHQYPIYLRLMGKSKANELVNLNCVVQALGSIVLPLLIGSFADAYGLPAFVALFVALSPLDIIGLAVPHFPVLVFGECVNVTLTFMMPVMILTWSFVYAPPEMVGTALSFHMIIVMMCAGIVNVVVCPCSKLVAAFLGFGGHGTLPPLLAPVIGLAPCTLVTAIALGLSWYRHPPPRGGSITMADVEGDTSDFQSSPDPSQIQTKLLPVKSSTPDTRNAGEVGNMQRSQSQGATATYAYVSTIPRK